MKHACEHCAQRYEIPTQKVIGKVLKVRCKSCEGTMEVVGPREGFDPLKDSSPPSIAQTQNQPATQNPLQKGGRIWWCGIGGKAHGPFSSQEVERLVDRGDVHARTRMWQSGMKNWVRISESPELGSFMEAIVQRTAEDHELLAGRDPIADQ